MKKNYNDKFTIIIHSCDNYEDLWIPFFTLFKKYWNPVDARIILNTESKDFSFPGLSIECVHPPKKNCPYGERMIHALSQVNTPYVIPLLDDFFLRKAVYQDQIQQIIEWMDKDRRIVCFNCDSIESFYDYEYNRYPGFKRLPPGSEYMLNMQAAVWRTEKLIRYWRPEISPWEWEVYTNIVAARNKHDKFYCASQPETAFCDYGYCREGMGVFRGKWVKDDVLPLFERENIVVDFSKRGFYTPETSHPAYIELRDTLKTIHQPSELIRRCLSSKDVRRYSHFIKRNKILGLVRFPEDILYFRYSLANEQKKFIKRQARINRIESTLKIQLSWLKYRL